MKQADMMEVNGGAISLLAVLGVAAPFVIDAIVTYETGKSISTHMADAAKAYADSYRNTQCNVVHTRPIHDGMKP